MCGCVGVCERQTDRQSVCVWVGGGGCVNVGVLICSTDDSDLLSYTSGAGLFLDRPDARHTPFIITIIRQLREQPLLLLVR